MRTLRFALVVLLLAAVPATGFSQPLSRRRAAKWEGLTYAMMEHMVPVVEQLMVEAAKDTVRQLTLDLKLALPINVFAELQIDQQMKRRIDSTTDGASTEAITRER